MINMFLLRAVDSYLKVHFTS